MSNKYNDMALMNKRILIQDLIDRTELLQEAVHRFFRLGEEELNYKPSENKWSIAEAFEHVTISHAIYLKYIHERIDHAKESDKQVYHSGWLGDWYYNKIMPRPDGTVYKMRTPRHLQPSATYLNGQEVLIKLLKQVDDLQHILEHSYNLDLEKTRVPLLFGMLLSLKLGDSYRFLIAHCERHLLQANKILEELQCKKETIAV